MWCSSCQQDVPGIASQENRGTIGCARCGQINDAKGVSTIHDASTVPDDDADERSVTAADEAVLSRFGDMPAAELDEDWALTDDVHAAQGLYRDLSSRVHGGASDHIFQSPHAPAEPPHAGASSSASPTPFAAQPHTPVTARVTLVISWSTLYLSLTGLLCGVVLMTWAYFAGRSEFWMIGLLATAVGQIGLVISLILQLDGLWQSHQNNTQSINVLDHRLSDLRQTTTTLRNTPHPSSFSPPYYVHTHDPVNTQRTLSEIKQQLDQLSRSASKAD